MSEAARVEALFRPDFWAALPEVSDESMQQAVRAMPGHPKPPVKPAVKSRLDAVEEEARSRGFEAGIEAGLEEGIAEGRKQGYLVGEEEGRRAGEEAIRQEVAATLDAYRDAIAARVAALDNALEARLDSLRDELAPLALEAVRRVIGEHLQGPDLGLADRIRDVLSEVKGTSRLTIRMNPVDRESLKELEAEIRERLVGLDRLSLSDDEVIEAGCVVEFDGGEIDLRVERTLQRMAQGVLGRADA